MPSCTESSVSVPCASSMVTTPSGPTWRMASARWRAISSSPLEASRATRSSPPFAGRGRDCASSAALAAASPRSIPRMTLMGSAPAAVARCPSSMSAAASTIAVVEPSPTSSLTFEPTWRIRRPPMSLEAVGEVDVPRDGVAVGRDPGLGVAAFDQHGTPARGPGWCRRYGLRSPHPGAARSWPRAPRRPAWAPGCRRSSWRAPSLRPDASEGSRGARAPAQPL